MPYIYCMPRHTVRKQASRSAQRSSGFCLSEADFCGYTVSPTGWTMHPSKTSAIREFPLPVNRTDLRSFLGLVNQFSEFTSHLAEVASPLRGLLKVSNEFRWEASHTNAFTAVKAALVAPPVLAYYQPGLDTRLETDVSRTKGLGFAFFQKHPAGWRLVQCGSRFITDTKSRYAMIELECLAVVWAINKCQVYLAGSRFELLVDHQPLVPIFNSYSLDQVEIPACNASCWNSACISFTHPGEWASITLSPTPCLVHPSQSRNRQICWAKHQS